MQTRVSTRLMLAAALAVAGLTTSSAQTRPAVTTTAASGPRIDVEKYTLPNGLEVLLSPDRQLPTVAVNIWYHVGPVNEAENRTGFAHLFEHMMFQCSKHVPCDQHLPLVQAAGGDVNGTTSFDRTNYYETLPSNQLELALWLESDRMGWLLDKVDQAALSNQQDVVRNERRQSVENQPYGLAEEAVVQALFPKGHPYHGNVIGSHEDLADVKLEDVKSFFKEYYAPSNATLAIVGDFDPAATKALVEKYFGTIKRGPAVPPVKVQTPTITSERRRVVPSSVKLPRVYFGWITSPIFKPGDADADIAATLLGGGRSSRLYKKLVYEKQIAQDVSAAQYSLTLGSMFLVEATARPGRTAEELEKALHEEIEAIRAQPATTEELERARNIIETATIGALERVGGVADRLNLYNHHVGTPDYLRQDLARYGAVTAATLQAFARDQLAPTARVVVHAVPGNVPSAAAPPAATGAAARQGTAATPSEGGAEAVNGDEPWRLRKPEPAAVRTVELPAPATATLSNGLTLMLDERHNLPVVSANLVFKTGSGANPLDRPGLANFVSEMLDEGTSTRNALRIADELANLGAALGSGSTMDATTVTGRSLTRSFPELLALMADVTLRPSFPAEEIERQRAQRLGQLVQARDDPSQVASLVTSRVLYGDRHPYGYSELGTEASVKTVTRDEMVAFWRQNLVPNNAALVVAGDITMAELRALADKAFGSWQRGTPVRPQLTTPPAPAPKVVIVDKPGAPQTQLRVATIGAQRSTPDFRGMQVMNMVLGGQFASRINMNLREKNGYTYGARSQFTFRRFPGPFQIASGVRTDVTGPAVKEIYGEVRGMLANPMSDDELKAAKDAMINSLPGAFEATSDAVGNFSNVFVYDLGLDYYTKYAAQVKAVDQEQALAMVKKYLPAERLFVVAVGDRAAIEPALRQLNVGAVEVRDATGALVK
jgi:zinc protease